MHGGLLLGSSLLRLPLRFPFPLQIIPAAIGYTSAIFPLAMAKGVQRLPAGRFFALRTVLHRVLIHAHAAVRLFGFTRGVVSARTIRLAADKPLAFSVSQSPILRKIPNSTNPLWRMLQSRRYSAVPIRTIVAPSRAAI